MPKNKVFGQVVGGAGGGPSGLRNSEMAFPLHIPALKMRPAQRHAAKSLIIKNNTINNTIKNNKDNPKITNKNKKLSYKNKLPGKSKKIEIYG